MVHDGSGSVLLSAAAAAATALGRRAPTSMQAAVCYGHESLMNRPTAKLLPSWHTARRSLAALSALAAQVGAAQLGTGARRYCQPAVQQLFCLPYPGLLLKGTGWDEGLRILETRIKLRSRARSREEQGGGRAARWHGRQQAALQRPVPEFSPRKAAPLLFRARTDRLVALLRRAAPKMASTDGALPDGVLLQRVQLEDGTAEYEVRVSGCDRVYM